jgi:hypothetical protein
MFVGRSLPPGPMAFTRGFSFLRMFAPVLRFLSTVTQEVAAMTQCPKAIHGDLSDTSVKLLHMNDLSSIHVSRYSEYLVTVVFMQHSHTLV